MAAISSGPSASTPELPPEDWALVFSYLDRSSLGQIAQVCLRFQQISESNSIWKPVHLREWQFHDLWHGHHLLLDWSNTIVDSWIGHKPKSWKGHARKINYVFSLFSCSSPNSMERHEQLYAHFWKFGLLNEAIRSTKSFDFEFMMHANIYALVGNSEKARFLAEQTISSLDTPCPEDQCLVKIICALEEGKPQEALSLYLDQRDAIIGKNPKMGWWICNILEADGLTISDSDWIYYPTLGQADLPLWQASAIIWLGRGLEKRALASLKCLPKNLQQEESPKHREAFLELFSTELKEQSDVLTLTDRFNEVLEKLSL